MQKKIILIQLAIGLATAGASFGLFIVPFLTSQESVRVPPSPTSTETRDAAPIPPPPPPPSTSFTSSRYGFTLKMVPGYTIKETEASPILGAADALTFTFLSTVPETAKEDGVSVTLFAFRDEPNIDAFAERITPENDSVKIVSCSETKETPRCRRIESSKENPFPLQRLHLQNSFVFGLQFRDSAGDIITTSPPPFPLRIIVQGNPFE